MLLTIMAALAQQESESLSQNVRLGIKFRNEQGKVMVNHTRFLGYTKDDDGHLIIEEAQAAIVRRKDRTDAPKYYVSGNHEPIISKETFAAVQQELARRADLLGDGKRKRIYSGKYPFSGMLFCGTCGDLYSRVIWSIHGRRQVVWRCMTRMQAGVDTCGSRYVDEEALQAMAVKAVNKAFIIHQSAADTVIDCVDEALNEELTDQAAALDEQIRTLQLQLMGYRTDSPEVERIGSEIIRLRNQKDELLSQTALSAQRTNEIRELASFFDGLAGPVETYDETYIRRLLSRITVFEDRLVFTFKDGKEVTIQG